MFSHFSVSLHNTPSPLCLCWCLLSIAAAWQSIFRVRWLPSWGVVYCVIVDALPLDENKTRMGEERGSNHHEADHRTSRQGVSSNGTTEIIMIMSNRDTRNQRCRSKELLILPAE
jgi:hypothetical protein